MHSRSLPTANRMVAAVLCGLLCTTSIAPYAFAQPKTPATKAAADKADKGAKGAKADKKGPHAAMTDAQKRAEARKHYAEGTTKFEAKDYEAALAAFQQANEILPSPQAAQKVAVCLDKLGRNAEAIAAYEGFLATAPAEKMASQIDEAKARVAALKSMPVAVMLSTDPSNATVELDGALQPSTKPLELKLTPGQHKLVISAAGYESVTRQLDIKAGDAPAPMQVALNKQAAAPVPVPMAAPAATTAPAAPATAPVTQDMGTHRSNLPAYITLGVAGAGVVVGTIFGIKALKDHNDFNDKVGSQSSDYLNSKADDAERNALIADMAFGVAVTLGVTGTVLLLSNKGNVQKTAEDLQDNNRKTMRLSPYVTPQGGGAAAVWRF